MSSGGHHGSPLPFFDALEASLNKSRENSSSSISSRALITAFIVSLVIFLVLSPTQTLHNFELLLFFSPLWIPYILGKFTWIRWVEWRRRMFIAKQQYILLELRMPRDTKKTPLSMEAIFANLHLGPGEANWYKKFWNGGVRPWWSFEIVSLGGRIHFYIWTRKEYRRPIESYFYAQYQGIEIVEATDYSLLTDPAHAPWRGFACEYKHAQPNAYPIKTYVDFGLDKAGAKPEEISDPLAQVIESMGAIGPKEQMWIQMIIRVHKGEQYEGMKNKAGKQYTWRDEGRDEIDNIKKTAQIQNEYYDESTGELMKVPGFANVTKGQSEVIAAIERNTSKLAFDVGMRGIYMAEGDAFQGSMPGTLGYIWNPFSSESTNKISWTRWSVAFNDYPWEDKDGSHKLHAVHAATEFYRRRAFFHPPYVGNWMTMSTEELATIFHVPPASVTTPSLPRIQSATAEAPSNLPI